MYARGDVFNLILADRTQGAPARQLAAALKDATSWHQTPFLALGRESLSLASDVSDVAALIASASDLHDQAIRDAA